MVRRDDIEWGWLDTAPKGLERSLAILVELERFQHGSADASHRDLPWLLSTENGSRCGAIWASYRG
jgi:hypothetical protein